jgi:hypothetical protein
VKWLVDMFQSGCDFESCPDYTFNTDIEPFANINSPKSSVKPNNSTFEKHLVG